MGASNTHYVMPEAPVFKFTFLEEATNEEPIPPKLTEGEELSPFEISFEWNLE